MASMTTRRDISRRGLLLATTAGVLAATTGASLPRLTAIPGTATDSVGTAAFDRPLAIPPLAASQTDAQGRRVFSLTAQAGTSQFISGRQTNTWGFNSPYLGPTLRARRGETVAVDVHNELSDRTTVHWHGMHLPAEADGGPHQVIEAGGTWSAEWTVDQSAGTLWYHPHLHGTTGQHVYEGLSGMFLLDDPEAEQWDLPSDYGQDDIPLIVQDRTFARDGAFTMPDSLSSMGVLGEHILVNGTYDPHLRVDRELVRLRLLNGSNNRLFDFGFDDGRDFQQIAGDGGLLEAPHTTDRVLLSPGERAEIVVAFEPDDDTILRSFPAHTGAFPEARAGGEDTFDILRLQAEPELQAAPELPERLAEIEPVASADADPDRVFELGDEVINGLAMDMGRIDHVLTAGDTEVWELVNTDRHPHGFHVHDKHFQVLSVNDERPGPELGGWKDTVLLRPQDTVRLALQVGSHTDPQTPYMFHCHMLTHEDNGMMGQFTVVEPGAEDEAPRTIPLPEGLPSESTEHEHS
jgi:blue copper oxidase